MDEHPDSIDDAWIITDVDDNALWANLPASYHNRACGLSFADGHSEIHQWKRAATCQPVRETLTHITYTVTDAPGSADIAWMINHCSSPLKGNDF